MNLFWSTRNLTSSREDHLTEFLAAALDVSESFNRAFAGLILVGREEAAKSPHIVDVTTQVSFPGTTCCPDMLLTLSDGRKIACEHKLDALETLGPEKDPRTQLIRYLDLPIDGLVYVRTSWKPPVSEVLNHPKYFHPKDREHFLWRDFYPILSCDKHAVLDWLREGFERLGFTPPHPSIGDMSGSDEKTKENRKNFAKFWQRTRSVAHALGWKVTSGSIVELYMTDNKSSLASWIFISPAESDRFLIRVTPMQNKLKEVADRVSHACGTSSIRTDIRQREVTRKDGKEEVIDITTTLREILGSDEIKPEEIEARLNDFVEPFLQVLQK